MTITSQPISAHALITGMFEIIDGRRWKELGRVMATDCVCRPAGSPPLIGLERIERYYREERAIASGRHQVEGVLSDLGAAACWGSFTGESMDGKSLHAAIAEIFLILDGKITQRTTYVQPSVKPPTGS